MKQLLTLAFCLFAALTMNAQTEKQRIEGFRDFKWGAHVDSITRNGEPVKFTKVDRNDAHETDGHYYTIKGDNMMIGNVTLTNVFYVFSKKDQRLFKVLLEGKKADTEQMRFIVDFKYGESVNEGVFDDKILKQWLVRDVYITLREFSFNKFELELRSDWQAAEAYKKNTNVKDF
jgi:hypothetical protein